MATFELDTEQAVIIPSGDVSLDGILHIPTQATGLVLFVHGSGSSRFSVRNQQVARVLNEAKLATLLFDLLTPPEDELDSRTRELRFDIAFLAERCFNAMQWCTRQLGAIPIGLFGASTGAGAALVTAAKAPTIVRAVVSRGGRPDLAAESLPFVKAPTLLIVGGEDDQVIELNKQAQAQMHAVTQLNIIPGATHLFEETGTLEQVAQLAKEWFIEYL